MSRFPEGLAIRVGSLVVAACFLWVTLNVVVAPQYGTVRWPQVWVSLGAAVVLVLLVLIVVASRGVVAWLEDHAWVRRGVVATSLVVMYAVQVRLGYSIRFNPGWDAGFLEVNTRAVADGSLPVGSVAETLAAYPNNLLFASLLTRYWRAWLGAGYTDGGLATVLLNAAVLCTAVVFVYLAARRLGPPVTAYVAGVFCFVFIGVSPWIGVVYSDTVGMVPIAILAYLAACCCTTPGVPAERPCGRPSVSSAPWATRSSPPSCSRCWASRSWLCWIPPCGRGHGVTRWSGRGRCWAWLSAWSWACSSRRRSSTAPG